MKKLMLVMVAVLLLGSLSANAMEVETHGLFYHYLFMWQNADFNSDVNDSDIFNYIHADINARAKFDNAEVFVRIGDWGDFGQCPIFGTGPRNEMDGAEIMHAYLKAKNLFEAPVHLTLGKMPVLYGDIAFDGGEDGYTGLKLTLGKKEFMVDLFNYWIESGGLSYVGIGTGDTTALPNDIYVQGAWATASLMEGKVKFNGFFFDRMNGDDMPMWVGVRSAGSPAEGFSYVGDFAMMMGSDAADNDYKGMYYSARGSYSMDPVSVGAGYYFFSGDDDVTDTDLKTYFGPTCGPYPNGFYKGWPGFGPAFTLNTPYGFSLISPSPAMGAMYGSGGLNVINGNLGLAQEKVSLRADFFMYKAPEADPSDMGMEFALHGSYHMNKDFTINATGGYWMPGDYFTGEDAMMAGYLYFAKGF